MKSKLEWVWFNTRLCMKFSWILTFWCGKKSAKYAWFGIMELWNYAMLFKPTNCDIWECDGDNLQVKFLLLNKFSIGNGKLWAIWLRPFHAQTTVQMMLCICRVHFCHSILFGNFSKSICALGIRSYALIFDFSFASISRCGDRSFYSPVIPILDGIIIKIS